MHQSSAPLNNPDSNQPAFFRSNPYRMYVDMISCLRSRSEPFPLPSQGCKVACRPGWLLRRLGLDPSRMDLDVSTIVATCLCLAEGEVVGDDDEEEEEEDEDGGGTRMAQQLSLIHI